MPLDIQGEDSFQAGVLRAAAKGGMSSFWRRGIGYACQTCCHHMAEHQSPLPLINTPQMNRVLFALGFFQDLPCSMIFGIN